MNKPLLKLVHYCRQWHWPLWMTNNTILEYILILIKLYPFLSKIVQVYNFYSHLRASFVYLQFIRQLTDNFGASVMYSIFTHFLAAILPIAIFFIWRYFQRRKQFLNARKAFWKRQRPEGLSYIQSLTTPSVPPPFNLIGELEKMQTAISTTSLAIEMGLIPFIAKKRQVTIEQVEQFLGFARRPVRAAVEVLLALGVLERRGETLSLTERAQIYLMQDSALYEPLPPARLARRLLNVARKGKVGGAIKRWQKGKAQTPERWALQQHRYSFPLGFALAKTEFIQNGQQILDVAGGSGAICIALAHAFPDLSLHLIELPGTIPITRKMVNQYQVADRIELLGMDMFTGEWPAPMDIVIFCNIFHDWSDEKCILLAQKAHEVLKPDGKILLIEALLHDDRPGPLWTAHWSMAMALFMEGRQFHGSEITAILHQGGFQKVHIQHLSGYYSLIVGEKA